MKYKSSYIISVYIDTNCINAKQDDETLNELEKFYQDEKIIIETTDTLETELREGKGYPKGLGKASGYIFSYGPAVLGHSRLGSSIVGSEEDDRRLGRVLEILFGRKPRPQYSKNEIRDAMHIATAIRYGGTYFVTKDRALLKKSQQIKNEFQIVIDTPEECFIQVKERLKLTEED